MRNVWFWLIGGMFFLLRDPAYAGMVPDIKVYLQKGGQNVTSSNVVMKDYGMSLCESGVCTMSGDSMFSSSYTITLYNTNLEIPSWSEWRKQQLLAKAKCHEFVKQEEALSKIESSWYQTSWVHNFDSKFGRGSQLNSLYQLLVIGLGYYDKARTQHIIDNGFPFYAAIDQCREYEYDYARNKYQAYLKQHIKGIKGTVIYIPESSIITDKFSNRHVPVEFP